MADYPIVTSLTSVIGAAGTASIRIGPSMAGESWDLDTVTVTSLNMAVSISQYGIVVDSTVNDPRATVTTDTPYHLPTGGVIVAAWSGGTPGTQVTVSVNGTKHAGQNAGH